MKNLKDNLLAFLEVWAKILVVVILSLIGFGIGVISLIFVTMVFDCNWITMVRATIGASVLITICMFVYDRVKWKLKYKNVK